MLKICTNCRAEYYARWRNEPTTVCLPCRTDVVLCAACGVLVRPPFDAAQLSLWPFLFMQPGRLLLAAEKEPHFSHGRTASNAEKRKYPYH